MKFSDYNSISDQLKTNLNALGFIKPTDIQYKSIPAILKGEDVLAIAQTGTGKTAAFAIPIIDKIHRQKSSKRSLGIQCLVMVPTRELAVQISEVFEKISKHTKVQSFALYGGVEQENQIKKLSDGIDILISTPGRMFDLISQGHISLSTLSTLVLDEADHMLDLGFIKDIKDVIRMLPRNRQTLFFSATIDEKIKKLAYSIVNNPIRIQISPKDPVSKNVDHSVVFVEMDDKRFFLERILKGNKESKILVFVRTKVRAERVLKAMERVGIDALTIHGGKDQENRFSVLKKFTAGDVKLLIATDVSARGIDIADVDFVVNYDLPEQPENYVHRVGRTGRGNKKGIAVSFCSEEEKEILKEIEQFVHKEIKRMEISSIDYEETIDFSDEGFSDWKSLLKENENFKKRKKKK